MTSMPLPPGQSGATSVHPSRRFFRGEIDTQTFFPPKPRNRTLDHNAFGKPRWLPSRALDKTNAQNKNNRPAKRLEGPRSVRQPPSEPYSIPCEEPSRTIPPAFGNGQR